jgi:2-C-methyl-D-erythritol 4-phosphate cytidylyltransferase/2-C-methyl-D-erythritol 2,4-cyclodiphosphate synthase
VSAARISRTSGAAAESGAALAALPASDTVKQASGLLVRATLDRSSIFLAQTPQAFRRAILEAALKSDGEATDEAALVERAGHPVRIVAGEASNIKITTSEDLALADALARQRPGAEPSGCGPEAPAAVAVRAGIGYDLHRMAGSGPLLLGGVSIPFAQGLEGHSDADAVCHAVTDAMLGAAAAGDLGGLFPDSDPRWKGASSIALLERAAEAVRDGGLEPANVDVVVIAERPRISPYVEAMRAKLAAALGVPIARVSIKGKTNEGVGELGRGEAIAVHAIALLRPRGA